MRIVSRLGLALLLTACETTSSSEDGSAMDTGSMDDGSADATAGPPAVEGCALPIEIQQAGVDPPAPTGFIRCNDGEIHRAQAVQCQAPEPIGIPCDGQMGSCDSDADCNDRPHGACLYEEGFFSGCACVYGCQTDADCMAGQLCACGGAAPDYPGSTQCIDAGCTTTAECGGMMCALGREVVSCGEIPVIGCRTEADACVPLGGDCGDDNCLSADGGPWSCVPPGVC